MGSKPAENQITVRCAFCGKLNHVDMTRAAARPHCGECSKPMLLDRPLKVAQDDFDRTVLEAGVPVMVDFYADWCGPCKMVAPLMDEIAHHHTGKVLVVKVDTDRAPEVAARYGIRSIPTVIVFEAGAETGRSVGFEPDRLRSLAEQAAA